MEERIALLNKIRLFVLDLDGTVYLGDRLLAGTTDFLQAAEAHGKKVLFFTNNTSRNPQEYIDKLGRMGISITRKDIMTAGDVTIRYLNRHFLGKRVYLLGVPALEQSFREGGIPLVEETPDLVVVGFDKTLTYEKLERACTFLRRGAVFLATHPDINCPTEAEPIPDCGAFCAAITASTGLRPKALGKPAPETVEMVLEATGMKKEETAFVGDRLYTDVACGTKNGANGLLVLTGETTRADLAASDFTPDGVFQSLGEIGTLLRQTDSSR